MTWQLWLATALLIIGAMFCGDPDLWTRVIGALLLFFVPALIHDGVTHKAGDER